MRGDVSKLPKWAQNEIRRLEQNEEGLRKRLSVGPEDSDTFAEPYGVTRRPLGRGTTILFQLGDSDFDRAIARVDIRGDGSRGLYLNTGRTMLVLPESSNALRIETRWS